MIRQAPRQWPVGESAKNTTTGEGTELATVSVFGRVQGELTRFDNTVREPDWGPL
jgi:TolB protein